MKTKTLELRTLRMEDESSFRRAIEEFARETPPWQFAFGFDEALSFSDYIALLDGHSRGVGVPSHFVPNTYFVGVVDGIVVGRLSLRHTLNESLAKIDGHIGYGVIPSQRKQGYATEMFRQVIPHCRLLGIESALISCDEGNIASRKVIEFFGATFSDIVQCPDSGAQVRKYWLEIE
jgi:predicted acetyltransferase